MNEKQALKLTKQCNQLAENLVKLKKNHETAWGLTKHNGEQITMLFQTAIDMMERIERMEHYLYEHVLPQLESAGILKKKT